MPVGARARLFLLLHHPHPRSVAHASNPAHPRTAHATSIAMADPQAANNPPQDALDKGVSAALDKTGHHQSNSTVEKITDGFRKVFKKATGKDVPIKDK